MLEKFLKNLNIYPKKEKPSQSLREQHKLTEEIKELCEEMEKTNTWFQAETDENLIESCIHQREALNARYRYLITKIKPFENTANGAERVI